jgi:beta-glucanase (GH16 family)
MRILAIIALPLLVCTSCNKPDNNNGNNTTLSSLTVRNVTHARDGKETTTYRFVIDVYPVCSSAITVKYTTKDGTAVSGKDYTSVSGTLTIPAKEYSGYIDVIVTADSLRQDDQTFTLELSSPVNSTLTATQATGTIQNPGTYLPIDNSGYSSAASYSGMTLTWSDEFNGKTLNPSNWTQETGGGGWGNSELEYYTNSVNNTFLTGGYLVIEARKETYGTNSYTSARLKTQDKKTFTYGRIDIRAKLPKGQGLWPALWMLGNNISQSGYSWPACGEIDIMELLGNNPQRVYSTVHWGQANSSFHDSKGGNYSLSSGSFFDTFHVFSMQWDATKMVFLVDDNAIFTINKSEMTTGTYPFDKPFFFIFNVAVGGAWPGNPDSSTIFPQRMIVDYVRIYQ